MKTKKCQPHEWDGPTRQALANTILTEYHNSGDEWASAMSNLDAVLDLRPKPDVSGPGFFSDGDMLHTCSFGHGRKGTKGMLINEYTAQFATYAVLASPIIISADLRAGSVLYTEQRGKDCVEQLLKNKDILAVHQDAAANAPTVVFTHNATSAEEEGGGGVTVTAQGFARTMADKSIALALLNRQDKGSLTLTATWAELGLPAGKACSVRDLLGGTDLPKATGAFSTSVGSHSASAVRITCR